MSQRFLRCAHCGLPHPIEDTACPVTGRPMQGTSAARSPGPNPRPAGADSHLDEVRRSIRPPESDRHAPMGGSALVGSANPTLRGGMGNSSPPPPGSQGQIPVTGHPSSRGQMAAAAPAPFESTPPPTSVLGKTLGGKYRVLRVLGEGGMGSVYECEHLTLHRRVAIKVLNPMQAKKKASVQRFHHEAQVAGAIGHPNICEIYDIGETYDGSPFLVMELLHGETLADRIASEGALPFDDVVEIISQVLSGLIAAHDKGIIHRDIKPENVFLSTRPGIAPLAKLLDFGISKVAGADDLHLTRTGMVMGTPFYMSPEQARGDRNLDHRVDLYATGVMMYECLTGRRPYTAANYNALLVQILTTSPRPPHELRPAVPPAFEDVVLRAMHREREKRFKGAAEMQRALVALRDPVGAGPRRNMASIPPEPVPLVTPRRDAAPPSSRRREEPEPPLLGDAAESDSGSIEIPIVTDDVKSVSEPAPPSHAQPRPVPGAQGAQGRPAGALYRPPSTAAPSRANPPIPRPRPQSTPAPASRPVQTQRGVQPPPSKLPPPLPSARKPRMVTPTPTPVDPRLLGLDAPWLHDHPMEGDPTEVGAMPDDDVHDPTEVGPLFGLKRPTDTPIDPDATEKIEAQRFAHHAPRPEPVARVEPRSVRAPRSVREVKDVRNVDPRRESSVGVPRSSAAPPTERIPDDEQPTTLFDRRAMKPSTSPSAPTRNTTERAPAPPSREEAPPQSTPVPRAPRRG